MAGGSSFSLTIGPDLLASLRTASAWRHMSVEEYARTAIEAASRMDIELAAFVQEGIESADRGELVTQDEMEAWFEARHSSAAAE